MYSLCLKWVLMPKGKMDVWKFDETPPILELLLKNYPTAVKRERISKYVKSSIDNKIYPTLLTRRLNSLKEEDLIEKEKRGYWKIKRRCYPRVYRKFILRVISEFSSNQVLPIEPYGPAPSMMVPVLGGRRFFPVIYGLNPNFMDKKIRNELAELSSNFRDSLTELNKLKQHQIDNFVQEYIRKIIDNPETEREISRLLEKYPSRIKEEIYNEYLGEGLSWMLYRSPSELKDFIQEHMEEDEETVPTELRLEPFPFLSELSKLSREKKDKVVEILGELASKVDRHFPITMHGISVFGADSYCVVYGGAFVVIQGKFPEEYEDSLKNMYTVRNVSQLAGAAQPREHLSKILDK